MQFKAGNFKLENREMIFQWGSNQLCALANQLLMQSGKQRDQKVGFAFI